MEVKPGYKQTEVGIIPFNWDVVSVGSLASFTSGIGINVSSLSGETTDTPVPVFGGNGIAGFTKQSLVREPTVIVGRVGQRCGEVYLSLGPAWITDNALYPRVKHREFDVRFLALALRGARLNDVKNRNDLPLVTQSILHSVRVAWPTDTEEQGAIVAAIGDVDLLLGALDRLIAKKRDLKQAAMQQLLTGQTRLPGFHGEWEIKRIADIASPVSEKNVSGQKLPVLTCSKHYGFMDSLGFFKNQVFSKNLATYKKIRRNEIGYPANHVEEGSIGLQDRYDVALVSPIYVVFRVNEGVNSFFLHRLLKLDSYRQRFKTATTSSVDRRGSLRWPAFSQLTVELPPTNEEQIAVAHVLSDMEVELAALEARRDKTQALKQAMMQELLTGKTRLVPNGKDSCRNNTISNDTCKAA